MIKQIWLDNITRWDVLLFRIIFNRNGKMLLDRFFLMISKSADGYLYAIAALLFFLIEPRTGNMFFTSAIFAFGLKVALYLVIKRWVRRKRPFDNIAGIRFLIAPPDQFSFPSGHTSGAFLFAVLCGHFFPIISVPLLLWSTLVGISRVYVGVHYPTDVLAGSILGILCAKAGLLTL
ncbi:phosphatase PAP2 family protein [bacterium]|nr:MAG: phosphatase PAP2 family protein [bacterium]